MIKVSQRNKTICLVTKSTVIEQHLSPEVLLWELCFKNVIWLFQEKPVFLIDFNVLFINAFCYWPSINFCVIDMGWSWWWCLVWQIRCSSQHACTKFWCLTFQCRTLSHCRKCTCNAAIVLEKKKKKTLSATCL